MRVCVLLFILKKKSNRIDESTSVQKLCFVAHVSLWGFFGGDCLSLNVSPAMDYKPCHRPLSAGIGSKGVADVDGDKLKPLLLRKPIFFFICLPTLKSCLTFGRFLLNGFI